jgi:hypothetical protein
MNGVYEYNFLVPADAADPNGHVSNIDSSSRDRRLSHIPQVASP